MPVLGSGLEWSCPCLASAAAVSLAAAALAAAALAAAAVAAVAIVHGYGLAVLIVGLLVCRGWSALAGLKNLGFDHSACLCFP